uniref:Uncharacterized protein n=1 Tax=Nelumbo nucifera TaxID=4432 RepID=A0A822XY25_NELNU|nr:TPA_asm: hypothetical protein HUJ06_023751 [Nelumbo nucifera]
MDEISDLDSSPLYPYLLDGDLNAIGNEKIGGRSVHDSQCAITNCQIVDLGFKDPKFTWSNSQTWKSLFVSVLIEPYLLFHGLSTLKMHGFVTHLQLRVITPPLLFIQRRIGGGVVTHLVLKPLGLSTQIS